MEKLSITSLINALNALKEKYGIIKEIRGKGLMIAIEFEKPFEGSLAEQINQELLKKRIILVKRPGFEVFRVDPAPTIEQNDIDYFLRNLDEILFGIRKQEDVREARKVLQAQKVNS